VFTDPSAAQGLIDAGRAFGIDALVVGRVEAAEKKSLVLTVGGRELVY
jgi:3-hydroxyisobutyrate dehydrogenase-like beta-hydroxyacid dehydrogenase